MSLEAELGAAAGSPVASSRRVAGGSINEAYAVEFEDGRRAFVKTRPDAPEGEYEAEAAALAWLGEPGTVRVPAVIAHGARFLALEWVEPGSLDAAGEEDLGRGLAGMHAAGAPAFGGRDLHIGPLRFDASPADDWPGFYAERLVRPLIAKARDRGALSGGRRRGGRRRCATGSPSWRARRSRPRACTATSGAATCTPAPTAAPGSWIPSPTAATARSTSRCCGCSAVRRAGCSRAYDEAAPLADGHEERVELWQLFPLMVHAVLFGGGYGGSAEAAARRYTG